MIKAKETIVVAMSGGVDSSVAAGLLLEQGYNVIGVTLSLRPCKDNPNVSWCCGAGAESDARGVAQTLGFPHYVVDAAADFETHILQPAWSEYQRGRTPSPCVLCNVQIKFAKLGQVAEKTGATRVATGHYAQIARHPQSGVPQLLRSKDRKKDQSYFLFGLSAEQLATACFPLGGFDKTEVRQFARKMGLRNAERAESQDACFVMDEEHFPESLRRRFNAAAQPGRVVDENGTSLGTHNGIHNFTIGQRKGLGIALGRRAYVSRIDPVQSTVELSDNPNRLAAATLTASNGNWLNSTPPQTPLSCQAQIRYRHRAAPAVIQSIHNGVISVQFETPQRAITPGQAVVFYDGETVIGGAWIDS